MFDRSRSLIYIAMMTALLSSSVAAQETSSSKPIADGADQISTQEQSDYLIGPGDTIDLRVFRQPELSGKYRVSEAGWINLSFVGQLQVAGLTEAKLADLLRDKLIKVLRKPELSVTVAEHNSQAVTVIGAVKTPGRYVLQRSERLLDVLGMCGGLNDIAGQSIYLVRYSPSSNSNQTDQSSQNPDGEESVKVETINLKDLLNGSIDLNKKILSGDVINVPQADTVYVTGNVNKPGAYNPRDPITLSQAIALAGGMTATARTNQISLFRVVPGKGERSETVYGIGDIEKRKVQDPILQPNDVIYIRGSESRNIGLAFVRALTNGLGGGLGFAVFR